MSNIGLTEWECKEIAEEAALMYPPLLEAYLGYFEDELAHLPEPARVAECKRLSGLHNAKERLAVYLTWNGIINYTDQIYKIATT